MNGKTLFGGLLLAASLSVQAGEIVDTYNTGDTLTATMLNNIKSAVNDNNLASRFYGDGSAGDLVIDTNTDWSTSPVDNLNFQDVVIKSGVTLTVPAGTVIRCTGNFDNDGTIWVLVNGRGGFGGYTFDYSSGRMDLPGRVASPGDTGVSSQSGASGTYAVLPSGSGGSGIPRSVAASAFMQFRWGGGAGSGTQYAGGAGGGLVRIQCRGAIRNNVGGRIVARWWITPQNSGGGGGGIVVLASQDSVTNAGRIDVSGGPGGNAVRYEAAGGGGGGGIAVLVAPSVTNTGTIDVSGGAAGIGPVGPANGTTWRSAGSGGGGSGGAGGRGASLDAAGVSTAATAGEDGYVLEIQADPSTMM